MPLFFKHLSCHVVFMALSLLRGGQGLAMRDEPLPPSFSYSLLPAQAEEIQTWVEKEMKILAENPEFLRRAQHLSIPKKAEKTEHPLALYGEIYDHFKSILAAQHLDKTEGHRRWLEALKGVIGSLKHTYLCYLEDALEGEHKTETRPLSVETCDIFLKVQGRFTGADALAWAPHFKLLPFLGLPEAPFVRGILKIAQEKRVLQPLKKSSKRPSKKSLASVLHLSMNEAGLKHLPASIIYFENLKELSLARNGLVDFPEGLWALKRLEILDLQHNKLIHLSEKIGQLWHLRKLILMKNRLCTLPESLGKLENLKSLALDGNKLTSLPPSFSKLKLIQLFLGENPWDEAIKNLDKQQGPSGFFYVLQEKSLEKFMEGFCSLKERPEPISFHVPE